MKSQNGGKGDEDDEALAVSSSSGNCKLSSGCVCWKCREMGHLKRDCKKKTKSDAGKGSGANAIESDSDWEGSEAFAVEDDSSLPELTSVSESNWDESPVFGYDSDSETGDGQVLFSDVEEDEVPNLQVLKRTGAISDCSKALPLTV